MEGLYLIFFLAILVFLAMVALAIVILRSGGSEKPQPSSPPAESAVKRTRNQAPHSEPRTITVAYHAPVQEAKRRGRQTAGWQGPFAFLSISLVIALWTIWGALFFLAVVWILRQNPRADSSFVVRENEKKTARRIYLWLLFSPILILPVFAVMLLNLDFPGASTNTRTLATIIPLVFHLPLVMGLDSKSAYIHRHTQQAVLLIALRAGVAALAISVSPYPSGGIWLFLLGNGSLWLLGSLWGLDQVTRGTCWLLQQTGESLSVQTGGVDDVSSQVHLERSREFIQRHNATEAKKHALAAFRNGDHEIRQQAVKVLGALNEVEEF